MWASWAISSSQTISPKISPDCSRTRDYAKYGFMFCGNSCTSLIRANGIPMKQTQEWLGHSDFGTTANTYTHLDFNSKLSSAQAMSDTLSGSNLFKEERERLESGSELA